MDGLLLDFGGVLDAPGAGALADFVAELRMRGIRVAVLSNDPGGRTAEPVRSHGSRVADEVILSGDVGVAKPDSRIYRLAADRLGVDPCRCVFVDDLPRNVRGAIAVGMVGVHHVDADVTIAELRILFDPSTRMGGDTWTRG